jgi:VanZ family protein
MPISIRGSFVAWLPALAWAAIVFALSAQPNLRFVEDSGLDFVVRKAGHMGVFGILALLAWRAFGMTTPWRRTRTWQAAIALTILYAATDEMHQGFVNGRHPSPVDVGIDGAGAVLAVVLVLAVARARARGHARAA